MIGRIYCFNWGDIILELKRSEPGSLCASSVERMMVVRTEGIWICVGMKDYELNWSLGSVCKRDFV